MTIYFTHLNGIVSGFYDTEYNYHIPDDAVEITQESYQDAITGQENGLELKTDGEKITPTPYEITTAQQKQAERRWAEAELSITDSILVSDSPYTTEHQSLIRTYRAALRNPAREATATYPAETWRPDFPSGVKRPGR